MFIFFQFIKLPQKKLHCFTEISELLFAFNCISISRSSQAMNCLQPFSNFHVQLTKIFTLQILSFLQKHYFSKTLPREVGVSNSKTAKLPSSSLFTSSSPFFELSLDSLFFVFVSYLSKNL